MAYFHINEDFDVKTGCLFTLFCLYQSSHLTDNKKIMMSLVIWDELLTFLKEAEEKKKEPIFIKFL